MYCAKCGSQLVASANYCHVCGTQIGGAQTQAARPVPPVYEVCETKFIMTKDRGILGFTLNPFGGKATWQWIAEANGPKGKYNAAVSPEFKAPYQSSANDWSLGPSRNERETKENMDQLVAVLLSTGWEPVDIGNGGLRLPKFRRRVN